MNKAKITRILAALVLAATVVCLCACESEAEQSTSTSAETTDATAWWKANTDISFELCVKSGENLTFESVDGDQGLILTMSDGKSVYILVEGLDYNDQFDAMIQYFLHKSHEKLSVGKNTKTIIMVYDSKNVEIVSKLSDMRCLTTTAPDIETAKKLFSMVMIRVEGADYEPLDLSDDFYEVK